MRTGIQILLPNFLFPKIQTPFHSTPAKAFCSNLGYLTKQPSHQSYTFPSPRSTSNLPLYFPQAQFISYSSPPLLSPSPPSGHKASPPPKSEDLTSFRSSRAVAPKLHAPSHQVGARTDIPAAGDRDGYKPMLLANLCRILRLRF